MADSATDLEQGTSPWDRLRRRKVVQWGLLYAAGAWGFLQGLEYVGESFHWPDQVRQVSILALLVGLPIVLVVAWYHGDRGEQRVRGSELAIITLLFLAGGVIFWRYDQSIVDATAVGSAVGPGNKDSQSRDPRPSIAVLPFENRSRLDDDAFFVDGIHDDILTHLSKVSALRVISRTSVERFRDTDLSVQQIAQQLGVTSILEGAVQRGGDRVRVNVQLIDAANDTHVWAEKYDRQLTAENIFGIQSEVADAIAGALRATLTAGEKARVNAVPTHDLRAWESYQAGRKRMAQRRSDSLVDAALLFREAIEIDPQFAAAYASLADTLRLQIDYSGKPFEATIAEADRLISKSLEIDPDLGEAWTAKAGIAMSKGDFVTAERLLRRAVTLSPNYAQTHHWLSMVLRSLGQQQAELEHARLAVDLDPLSGIANLNLGDTLEAMGRYDEAAARYQQVIAIDPQSAAAHHSLAITQAYALNRFADAAGLQERAVSLDPASPLLHAWLIAMLLDLGNTAEAEQMVETAIARWPDELFSNIAAAVACQLGGDADAAYQHAKKALAEYPKDRYSLRILGNQDLRRGDLQGVRLRYESTFPELLTSPSPRVTSTTLASAIDLALVLKQAGDLDRAAKLLTSSEGQLATMSRLGTGGYGIADAQIHALRGNRDRAIAALRQAQKAGWRGPLWRYYRDIDPTLESIRHDSDFKAIFADIERDMAKQRAALAARPKDAPLELAATGT